MVHDMSTLLIGYIKESVERSGIYYLNKEIPVWSDDPLPEHINLRAVLDKIETMLPNAYFRYVDAMKIGTFPEMIDRFQTFKHPKKICTMILFMKLLTLLKKIVKT